jgi:SAM-dependent methyltransferase
MDDSLQALPPETNALAEVAYDTVYAEYNRMAENDNWPRMRWLKKLLDTLPNDSAVLDVGCGSAVPAGEHIAAKHRLTGFDISQAQVELARRNVPTGVFHKADLSTVQFPDGTFDAVVSFYTPEQVPRRTHGEVFSRIAAWLKPGGHLLFSVEAADYDDAEGTWLGMPIFLSVHKPETTKALVAEAGFRLLESSIEKQFEQDHDIAYLWVLAQRI